MKKSLKIILTLVLVLASVFGLSKIRSAHADGSTGKIQITSKTITPAKSPVDQYTDIKVDLTFNVPNGVKSGDQAVITLPQNLKFISDQTFDVMSPDGQSVVAKAVINAANKTITLTYENYVEKKSNISGSMFFAVRVEPATASPSKVPITLNVDNNPVPVGKVDFVVDPGNAEKTLDKVSWGTETLADGSITRQYEVRVNSAKEPLTEAVVTDQLQTEGMSYVEDSFVIKKGNWAVNSSHKLELKNGQVVSLPVEFGADKKSFKVSLGNVAQGEGYSIVYKVKIPYTPANGEKFLNNVTLNAKKVVETKSNPFVYQTAGGEAQGYTFSINLKKVDSQDENTALAGAEFNVIRVATGAVVGKLTTNAKGEASIGGLLNTAYQLVETKAPEGYELDATPIDVKAEDFGTTKTALKTVTNKKTVKEPTPTSAVIELDKALTGRDLVDGEFSFELYEGANKLQTVTNKAGKVSFDAISYTAEGDYTYTVKEVKGTTPGITYDTAEKQVTVKVTKDGDNLKATVVYPESKVFANTYSAPSPAKAQISASKILEGRALKDGEFSFSLLDEAGKVLQTKQNAADGSVAFDEISYSQEDAGKTFHYTIKEVIPTSQEKGMTYDQASIDVTVTVTKDEASNTINATVAYGEKKSFINTFVTNEIPPTPPTVDKPEAKLYTIQLHKVNGEGQALAGAVFGLFEADGVTAVANPYGEGQATATSDANGLVSFVGFAAKDYVVKELTAPEGYQLSTASITVSEAELTAATDLVLDKGNVVNKPFAEIPPTPPVVEKPEVTVYSIQLHKVNSEGQVLAGAVFGLFEADGTTPVANPYGEGQATATSDANGLVTFTGLVAKDYVVKEITAPEGYQLSEKAITVSSSQLIASTDQVSDQGKVVNKPFTAIPPTPPVVEKPEVKLYTIQLHKVNAENQALAGAVFGLFEADGTTPVADPYGEGQATATSDANGLVRFVGFAAKDYVVKELTAPEGYQLSTISITVSASELNAAADLVVDKGSVVNKPFTAIPPTPPVNDMPEAKLYTIQLHKVDGEGKALEGAVFGLFEKDGTTPVANPYGEGQATATSDANGLVSFVGFEAKDYVVKELTAPKGYQLLDAPIKISTADFEAAKDLVLDKGNVVNEKTPNNPPKGEGKKSLPSTGQSMSEGLVAAGLALTVAGSALVYKKREN